MKCNIALHLFYFNLLANYFDVKWILITFIKLFLPYIWNYDKGLGNLLRKVVLMTEHRIIYLA